MKDQMFDELINSVQEAGAIRWGEQKASRLFHVDAPDVKKKIRESLNLSQRDFSTLMGISLRTLQNWIENGAVKRRPHPCIADLT